MKKIRKIINIPQAQEFIKKIGGEDAAKVVRIYEKKGKVVTDEELAKKMRLKVTEVRTILNRLHYRGVACYQKSKNTKTGWYSYTWSIKSKRIAELVYGEMIEKMTKLEAKQAVQSNYGLFTCKGICEMIPFEVAAEYNFKCPDCGKPMGVVNNKKVIRETEREICDLQGQLDKIKRTI